MFPTVAPYLLCFFLSFLVSFCEELGAKRWKGNRSCWIGYYCQISDWCLRHFIVTFVSNSLHGEEVGDEMVTGSFPFFILRWLDTWSC